MRTGAYLTRWTESQPADWEHGNWEWPPQSGWPSESAGLCQPGLCPDQLGALPTAHERPRAASIRPAAGPAGGVRIPAWAATTIL